MNNNQEIYDRLDQYLNGTLPQHERVLIEEQLKADPAFKKIAEDHFKLVHALKFHDRRVTLRQTIDNIHEDAVASLAPSVPIIAPSSGWKKYWPITAVAASVSLISVLGTLLIVNSHETKQTAYYKELRRKVDQIKKSQSQMMADIAETKGKVTALPETYAGTGFLISSNGYVATSSHVIKGADSVYIENPAFGQLKTTVLINDESTDVAILKIHPEFMQTIKPLPYLLSNEEANLGEEVYTLGFPREDIVFGEGSVSASTGYRQNPNAYQISVPVNPGNSGGPLFNQKGDLIGIISGLQTETSGAAFAIKSSVLLNVIKNIPEDSLSNPLLLPRQNNLKYLSRIQQIKKWKDCVFLVKVYNTTQE